MCGYSEREFQRGDEIAWYADGDKIVRNEYNPAAAYAFGDFFFLYGLMNKMDAVFGQFIKFQLNGSEKC